MRFADGSVALTLIATKPKGHERRFHNMEPLRVAALIGFAAVFLHLVALVLYESNLGDSAMRLASGLLAIFILILISK